MTFDSSALRCDPRLPDHRAKGAALHERFRARSFGLETVDPQGAERASLERFIAARFARIYRAHDVHFCIHLLGLRDRDGGWRAAAGYTPAHGGSLFLEQYLNRPAEDALAQRFGERVERERVVEVGNLASSAGMGRGLILAIGEHLFCRGYEWAVFTATREVGNALRRLSLAPLQLVRADPARVAGGGAGWGSYYAHHPAVMGGRLVAALRRLPVR